MVKKKQVNEFIAVRVNGCLTTKVNGCLTLKAAQLPNMMMMMMMRQGILKIKQTDTQMVVDNTSKDVGIVEVVDVNTEN